MVRRNKMRKIRKIIYVLLLGIFSMQVIAVVWLHISYFSNLPKMPNEETGRTYQVIVNHGSIRYGSEREVRVLRNVENFQPIAITCFLIAVTMGLLSGDFKIAPGRKLDE
jgi:hypothetical protein